MLGRWVSRPVGLFDKTPSRSKSIPAESVASHSNTVLYGIILECHAVKIFLGFLSLSTEVGGPCGE